MVVDDWKEDKAIHYVRILKEEKIMIKKNKLTLFIHAKVNKFVVVYLYL